MLKYESGEELQGGIHHEEIQKVGAKVVYLIESVLQERNAGGQKEYLVKQFSYPASINSCIPVITRYRY